MNTFKNKNVLITGGLGFIGSNLCRKLLKLEANIQIIDSMVPEYGGNMYNISGVQDQIKVNISDVRDKFSLEYLVQDQDYLFNLAGQTSHMDSMKDPYTDLEINSKSQLSILEACRHHNTDIKIVFASTRQLYGKPSFLPVSEEHPINPVDVNGINKMAGESYHLLYNQVYGIRTTVLRLTNTIGPRMRIKDARQTFVGIWIRNLIQGKPFEVWGGEQLRDFTYVDDCIEAMLLAAQNDIANGKIYNLGGKPILSLLELADLLVEIYGDGKYQIHSFPEERKKIDIGDYYSDYTKINDELSWEPKTDFKVGLLKTINYYRKNIQYYI